MGKRWKNRGSIPIVDVGPTCGGGAIQSNYKFKYRYKFNPCNAKYIPIIQKKLIRF